MGVPDAGESVQGGRKMIQPPDSYLNRDPACVNGVPPGGPLDWPRLHRLLSPRGAQELAAYLPEEARKTTFCPSQEKIRTVVLWGVRNISEAP